MIQEAMWPAIVVAAVVALLLGFVIGRFAGGARKKADQLAAELQEQRDEAAKYRQDVDAHFDKTATLFVSMAGSYKELFEHLSSGYERLSDKSARDLFRERVDTMLLGAASSQPMIGEGADGEVATETQGDVAESAAAADTEGEAAAAPADETVAGETPPVAEGAPGAEDGETDVIREPAEAAVATERADAPAETSPEAKTPVS